MKAISKEKATEIQNIYRQEGDAMAYAALPTELRLIKDYRLDHVTIGRKYITVHDRGLVGDVEGGKLDETYRIEIKEDLL